MITALWISYSLLTETLLVTIHLWPISGLLVLNALAAVALTHSPATPGRIITLMSSFMSPGLILAIAGSCWHVIGQSDSAIPTIGVTMIFGIQILLSIGIVYRLAGNRWVATSVSMIAVWFGFITWFLAGMTLTSVWL